MIRVALLSRWHVHADDYANQVKENRNLAIQMVWDEDMERGLKWARELGVPFEHDLDAVLAHPEVDAVVVSTPTQMHKEVIMKAAAHKKHIFTEKVLALTVQECAEIYAAVEAENVHVMVSLPRLAEREFIAAENVIAKGWLGALTMVRCRLAHNGAVAKSGSPFGWLPERFFQKEQTGGGALIDLGAHPIYLTNRLAGLPQAVYARLQNQTQNQVDDQAAVMVEYESGALGIMETSFVSYGSPFQLELYGTEGTCMITEGRTEVKSVHVHHGEWMNVEAGMKAIQMPMEQWVDAIKFGAVPAITTSDVIELTRMNQAAALSHDLGRRVTMDEVT